MIRERKFFETCPFFIPFRFYKLERATKVQQLYYKGKIKKICEVKRELNVIHKCYHVLYEFKFLTFE